MLLLLHIKHVGSTDPRLADSLRRVVPSLT